MIVFIHQDTGVMRHTRQIWCEQWKDASYDQIIKTDKVLAAVMTARWKFI